LASAMARRNVELRVAIRANAERAARLKAHGVTPVELPFGGVFDLKTRRRLAGEAAEFAPQIFLSFMSRAASYAPVGVPGERLHIGRLGGYYSTKYYRGCDHLIGNTKGICRYLTESGLDPARVHHLPNFVDESPTSAQPRSDHGTPAEAPLIVALGRLHRNKAFDILLQAVATVPKAHLWLAGTGELAGDLQAQTSSLGIEDRVRFLGWIENPAPLLEAADIVCVPSRHEPLGNVILEAWTRRRPVVAAASEGPSELVRDGQNGLLVPVDDAPALAAALQRVRDDVNLAARLADAGYATWQKNFSENAVVDAYLTLFDRLCDQAGIKRASP
jgi:glycosyltransferase involved in cell wall biosynthesis